MRGPTGGLKRIVWRDGGCTKSPHTSRDLYVCGSAEKWSPHRLEPAVCNTPSVHLVRVIMLMLSMYLAV